jgi:hypothetical protein
MESLEDEALDLLKEIREAEETGTFTQQLYDEFLEVLAKIAVQNGIDKMKFFDEAAKIIPFDVSNQLNDDESERSHQSQGAGQNSSGRFWSNLDKVTKVLRFINASYRFLKNVSDCLGGIDSD